MAAREEGCLLAAEGWPVKQQQRPIKGTDKEEEEQEFVRERISSGLI